MRNIWICLMAGLLLSGCVPDMGNPSYVGGSSYGYGRPTYYGSAPGYYGGGYPSWDDDGLNRRQQEALNDGCDDKYGSNKSKRRACKNQSTDGWRDALKMGCKENYGGNKKAYRRCLDGL
jgi:hypothetical protein